MGCGYSREKEEFLRVEQKWDYVNLNDFKSNSMWTPVAYGYLWFMLLVSMSVYVVDTFTCINLIVFDKWSGQIKPVISFKIARWIFAGCILLSLILLVYRWLRAIRVMTEGGVARSYLDPLAVRIQSIRMGANGRGWKRFLVFAELTKSRKGADYVALFSYFSFEAWLRVVFAEGPRQVVNALTLYAVLKADLIPDGKNGPTDGTSPFVQFWYNVGRLAHADQLQATILVGMLWTLIIWVISALSLLVSVILYLIFLWHHIPSEDGSLTVYCRKKINRRMQRVVKTKGDKALKKENELRARQEAQAQREGRMELKKQPTLPDVSVDQSIRKQPTLPIVAVNETRAQPTLPNVDIDNRSMLPLSRSTTATTLPEYHSRPTSARDNIDPMPPMPSQYDRNRYLPQRHATQASDASWASYNSNAPLMSAAEDMGYTQTPAGDPRTPASAVSTQWSAHPMPHRNLTDTSNFSDPSFTPGSRTPTAQSFRDGPDSYQMEPLPRAGTAMSNSTFPRRQESSFDNRFMYRGPTPAPLQHAPPGVNGSYFPPVAGNDRSALDGGPPRSYTPYGGPPRTHTPQYPAPPRSHTPQGSPPRSRTPQGIPSRSHPPQAPPMPATQSYASQNSPPRNDRSIPFDPPLRSNTAPLPAPVRPFTPAGSNTRPTTPQNSNGGRPQIAAGPPPSLVRAQTFSTPADGTYVAFNSQAQRPAVPPPQQQYRSYSRPGGPALQNMDANRDSGFDDILDHY